ncbi:response regulator transcription factor [Herpetosiphon giganteus]|uniref:response regulator transcription factor n=1 Tax=Herpetosiphon giganteus TaxID=2029754 RepID=UPI0019560D43|nr:response regulator transcription factor [Herpetosiphon giganteus]MBM7842843.1 DNA-binding response OmpR family regulator [Herpetosiphon giganteus]
MSQASILLVDDEFPIRATLGDLLRRRGYDVQTADSGEEALDRIAQRPFDLFLLDLRLPGVDGITVAQRVRERYPDAAILILTGHGSLDSAIEGIHLGVFDYMLKTSSPQDVLARVKSALEAQSEQRHKKSLMTTLQTVVGELGGKQQEPSEPTSQQPAGDQWIRVGELEIGLWRQMARLGEQTLNLTPTEFRLLSCLAQQAGLVMSYANLLRCAQGYEAESSEAAELLKPHIYHLRQKIEPDPSNPRYILTVRGTGYVLAVEPPQSK